jgi:hypothetical protein
MPSGGILFPPNRQGGFLEKLEFLIKSAYFNSIFCPDLTDEVITNFFSAGIKGLCPARPQLF